MASREDPLVNEEYYHVFNRGVAKQTVFSTEADYSQAMLSLDYYQYIKPPIKLSRYKRLSYSGKNEVMSKMTASNSKLVQVVAFVLMPNHWHLLLKQLVDEGISKYIGQLCNSYTRYYNTRHIRVGHIFQGTFKSVRIESDQQLIHVSRYIHLNPYAASMVKKSQLSDYPWSSLSGYLNGDKNILGMSAMRYKEFVFDHADYARELESVKHLIIDSYE
ncbi:MAG: transposase [Candidatus Amesbacteria bacterium]|nr:transposase [Candidatus Amesbacteria bacterium]